MAESHSPAGLKVAWRRYHACSAREHGNPRRPIPTPSTGTKERVSPKASANANGTGSRFVRGSTSGGAHADASCRSRGVLAMMNEAIRVVRRADSDAPCGYRCAVRVTGQASSCAHILSHPLSAACRPVSPRRAYLSKVEAAQPLPRESSLGRPSGIRAVATPFSCGSMVLVL